MSSKALLWNMALLGPGSAVLQESLELRQKSRISARFIECSWPFSRKALTHLHPALHTSSLYPPPPPTTSIHSPIHAKGLLMEVMESVCAKEDYARGRSSESDRQCAGNTSLVPEGTVYPLNDDCCVGSQRQKLTSVLKTTKWNFWLHTFICGKRYNDVWNL
jgi:hypothetical protein